MIPNVTSTAKCFMSTYSVHPQWGANEEETYSEVERETAQYNFPESYGEEADDMGEWSQSEQVQPSMRSHAAQKGRGIGTIDCLCTIMSAKVNYVRLWDLLLNSR